MACFLAVAALQGRHLIRWQDQWISLTRTQFDVFIDLVLARLTTHTGYLPVSPSIPGPEYFRLQIHRLRRTINETHGEGAGARLIETGCDTEYRLTVAANEILADASFFELPSATIAPALLDLFRRLQSPQSQCNGGEIDSRE